MTYYPLNGRGYGHMTVLIFAVCRDVSRRTGLLAIADPWLHSSRHSVAVYDLACPFP